MSSEFNFLEQPDDLLLLTVPADIRYCIVSLLRFLQGVQPSHQEQGWATQATIAAAPGQWFEMRRGGLPIGYIQAEESRGRYTTAPPENVDRDKMIPLEMPDPPPTTLRDFLSTMLDRLTAQDPSSSIDFLPYRDAFLRPEGETGYLATREFVSALAAGAGLHVSEALVMEQYENALLKRFDRLLIRGEIVGIMLMLCGVSRKADPQPALTLALRNTPKAPVHDLRGFGNFVLSGVLSQLGGAGWIRAAAQELRERVEAKLDKAASAKSVGEFYGETHASIPFAYGAKRGFCFLADSLIGDEAAGCQVLANQCDERFASGMAALNVDFGNSMDWRFLLSHRRMVDRQRRLNGEAQADAVATELIDISMTYPAFFRSFLLGKTDTLITKMT